MLLLDWTLARYWNGHWHASAHWVIAAATAYTVKSSMIPPVFVNEIRVVAVPIGVRGLAGHGSQSKGSGGPAITIVIGGGEFVVGREGCM